MSNTFYPPIWEPIHILTYAVAFVQVIITSSDSNSNRKFIGNKRNSYLILCICILSAYINVAILTQFHTTYSCHELNCHTFYDIYLNSLAGNNLNLSSHCIIDFCGCICRREACDLLNLKWFHRALQRIAIVSIYNNKQ